MNDRVTWLIPIKNGMPYLPETLASIEAQTYKNWEILVWDNGSTDGTLEELKRWIPDRLPGKIVTGEPLTLGGSLARMVEICETELCARIDADDINLPDRLEEQVKFLAAHPDVALLGSLLYFIDEQGISQKDLYPLPSDDNDIMHGMLTRNTIFHPSVMFRRSAVLQVGNYRDLYLQWNKVNIEDYDLWLRVAQKYKLANLKIPLVKYRIHANSTTQLSIKENRLNKSMDDCICELATMNFGCSESDMRLLRERNHPFAIKPILQIAKYLQQDRGGTLIDRLRMPSFIDSTKNLISSTDAISSLFLSACHPDRSFLYRELKGIARATLRKIPGMSQIENKLIQYRSTNK